MDQVIRNIKNNMIMLGLWETQNGYIYIRFSGKIRNDMMTSFLLFVYEPSEGGIDALDTDIYFSIEYLYMFNFF